MNKSGTDVEAVGAGAVSSLIIEQDTETTALALLETHRSACCAHWVQHSLVVRVLAWAVGAALVPLVCLIDALRGLAAGLYNRRCSPRLMAMELLLAFPAKCTAYLVACVLCSEFGLSKIPGSAWRHD